MELIWSDELSIGIHEIDEQHKVLVDMYNELADAIRDRNASSATVAILGRLADYTKVHFAVEESMMRLLGYPGYDEHKNCHEELIDQLHDLQSKVFQEKKAINFELLHFLRVWLVKHIQETDTDYARHFCERGLGVETEKTGRTSNLASMWSNLWTRKE